MGDDSRTVWIGNLSDKVTEELLYELFLQVAPLDRVRIPTDKEGRKSSFGFVTMKHEVSVDYAVQLLNGTSLFDKRLNIKPRNTNNQNHAPTPQRNNEPVIMDHQNLMNNFNDLFRMGQLMQLNYLEQQSSDSSGHGGQRYGDRPRERNRDDFQGHKQHYNNRNEGYNNANNRQGRGGYHGNNHRNNYDRNNRRQRRYY